MTAQHRIDHVTLEILSRCVVSGNNLFLPPGQLDRRQYETVNKVLELMGGKWNRKARAHIYSESPADLLDTVVLTGEITDRKKLFQFFETPVTLAARMVELSGIGSYSRVLEPSAGSGRILKAIGKSPDKVAVELDHDKVLSLLAGFSGLRIVEGDFLQQRIADIGVFDAVIMNPPFTRGQDVRHIEHARTFLKPGGTLVAICANGPRQREALMGECQHWEDLPAGTFSESGTQVSTALLVIKV